MAPDPDSIRIREALVELIAEHGLEATSLPMVAERAGLSSAELDRRYRTFQDCLDDAWEQISTDFMKGLGASNAGPAPWRDRLRASAYFVLRYFQQDVARANFFAISMRSGRDLTQARIYRIIELGVELVDGARQELPDPESVPRSRAEGVVGAIHEAVLAAARKGDPQLGAELLPQLMYIAVMPYLGLDAAQEELRRGPADLARYRRGEL